MEAIEELLRAAGIPFRHHDNRIEFVIVVYYCYRELCIYFNLTVVSRMP
jgi:hypothetical protein